MSHWSGNLKIMKKIALTIVLFCGMCAGALGQDIHFSFPEFSPLALNPAMAGANWAMEGMINYRNQWTSLGAPFKTTAAAFHARIPSKQRNPTNQFAMGIQAMNDKAGLPGITSNSVALTVADHVRINRQSKIGLGISVGFAQRTISQTGGEWASQYDGNAFNPALPSGEVFSNPVLGVLDASAGILYTYRYKQSTLAKSMDRFFNIGFSAYHLNRPNNSFFESTRERLPVRYTAFANGEFALGESNAAIMPGIWYHRQGVFSQLLLGSSMRFKIVDETRYTAFEKPLSIVFGLFGRLKDAAIARVALDWDRYSIGYAFDFNTSGLRNSSGGQGAQEIFLRVNLSDAQPLRTR